MHGAKGLPARFNTRMPAIRRRRRTSCRDAHLARVDTVQLCNQKPGRIVSDRQSRVRLGVRFFVFQMCNPCARFVGCDNSKRLELAMQRTSFHSYKRSCAADIAPKTIDLG